MQETQFMNLAEFTALYVRAKVLLFYARDRAHTERAFEVMLMRHQQLNRLMFPHGAPKLGRRVGALEPATHDKML